MPNRQSLTIIAVIILCISPLGLIHAMGKYIDLGFSPGDDEEEISKGWEHITYFLAEENRFYIKEEQGKYVIHVKSLNSSSALLKRVDIVPEDYPLITWRWRINRPVGMAIEGVKERNDSAARVRIVFGPPTAKDPLKDLPGVAKFFAERGIRIPVLEPKGYKIDYIWSSAAEKGEVLDYPGNRHHKVIVLERGKKLARRWVWEKRDMVVDFENLFGFTPPSLSGVLILSDTDQTNEGVEADFADVVLMKRKKGSGKGIHKGEPANHGGKNT